MAQSAISILLKRQVSLTFQTLQASTFLLLRHSGNLTLKPYSTSSLPDPPKPSSLSARMSFVFEQIDAIERERAQKDETLQRIRAWRESKNTVQHQEQRPDTIKDKNPEILRSEPEALESRFTDNGDSRLNLSQSNSGVLKERKEVEVVHPWPEWIELMQRLVQQNYFDHRRMDEDKMVQDLGFDAHGIENDDEVRIDLNDFKTVQTACINFGKDRFDIFRSLSRQDIQILVGYGCPSADKKVAFSAKLLRKHVHLDEGDVCSKCSLRNSCEKAYLLTNKEDEPRTIDVMRVLLTYGFDPLNGSVVNKSLLKQKSLRSVVRKLLHELVKLSAVPIDPNLPPPIIRKPPPKVKQPPPPPKRRVGRDDVEMKKGDWLCPKCDFMNFAKNTVCLQCDAKRPKRQLLPGEWECPECNFLNYRRNMVCFHCDCKRPPDEFIENKMEERQHIHKTGLEQMPTRPEVSNAWNFDFDDAESDGAEVAAFEYADHAAMDEDSPLDARNQRGNFRGPHDDVNRASRSPGVHEREFCEPSSHRPRIGFDDFDDEDDVDCYELDTNNDNHAWKASENNFSRQGILECEDGRDSDDNSHGYPRKVRASHTKPSKSMHKNVAFSGSEDDDIDLDDDLSVHPKWKSSHIADIRHRNGGRSRMGQKRGLSFGSDEEMELDSDVDDDFGSGRRKGNKQGSGRRNYQRRSYSFSGSESDNDKLPPRVNRGRRNNMEVGRRDNFRHGADYDFGRNAKGRYKGRMDEGRNSWNEDFDRPSHNRSHNKNGGGGKFGKGGFQNRGMSRDQNRGRPRDHNMDLDRDFGEFRNSRRVIER